MKNYVGDRAIVLGGSVTGLFAVSPLAEAYREVIVVDRDELIGVREVRRGSPQARHINGLLARGARAMEDLFPEITAEMISAGCPQTDLAGTVRWYFNGKRLAQQRAGLSNVAARRPIMEVHLRERIQAMPNVRIMERHDINGLVFTADNSRVTGVRVQPTGDVDAPEQVIEADLVVDATGRGSRSPLWLEATGYGRAPEEGTKMGLGYATRHYRLGATNRFGTDHSIVCVASAESPRGAICTRTDDGLVELTTYGILGDHPPLDDEGFNSFIKSLAATEIYDMIIDAEPVNDPVLFRFPTTLRRRFESLERFPAGLVVVGDAVCTPNPVFAQAQTLAALQALAMRDRLRAGGPIDSVEFMAEVGRIVDPAWQMTETINLSYPGVEGERPPQVLIMLAYMKQLHDVATRDSSVTEAFLRTASLVDPPESLMHPELVWKVTQNLLAAALPAREGAAA
ncbi:FAD-binding monooxygenase [Solwaraspora sp. WMMA2056]|uniref:NAD(P)/FAD-dependent oxidoreductase n=1 Tax=Solwaraspora sp. WMMA2056 TaxID=3015161 RepID=UPI00259B7B12|nr:FAD-binding monooxygenase [Solwaraspora sp. WMMA2056]WJK42559.1 FAD-binding monooxygenase [Solwaraspora sp. WMMA2056]